MSKRWKVENTNYDYPGGLPVRLLRTVYDEDQPWSAWTPSPGYESKPFATHAEAITYADKQARRTA